MSEPREDIEQAVKDALVFFVNGKKITLHDVDPAITLAVFLRRNLRLTGTKLGCGEGSCGSCTVMVSYYDKVSDTIRHKSVTSCLVPICSLHGMAVTTIEALGNLKSGLNPIQERLVKYHGTQCGFCSPGMVMSMYTLLRNNHHPTLEEITNNLQGNICRCTGYRSIIDAFGTFAKNYCPSGEFGSGSSCCRGEAGRCGDGLDGSHTNGETSSSISDPNNGAGQANAGTQDIIGMSLESSQELIFPPELKIESRKRSKMLTFDNTYIKWYRPSQLKEAIDVLTLDPNAIISAGFTYIGQMIRNGVQKRVVVDVSHLEELKSYEIGAKAMKVGAGLTISEILHLAESSKNSTGVSNVFLGIPEAVNSWERQLKNSATLGGHVMLRKPKYDLLPLLIAGDCFLEVTSCDGKRNCPINQEFSQKPSSMKSNEIVTAVGIPLSQNPQFVRTYRVAKRKHQAFASLNAAFVLDLSPTERLKVNGARIVFGGDIPEVVVARDTQTLLSGRTVTESSLTEALTVLKTELSTAGFSDTQIQWAQGFLTKCLLEFMVAKMEDVDSRSTYQPSSTPWFQARQMFEIDHAGEFSKLRFVGQPLTHISAEEHTTGEAIFIDDLTPSVDELFMQPVLSTRAHATITAIDLETALALPGVHGYVDSSDVPGINFLIPSLKEEELFATETVYHHGQLVLGIIADNRETATKAASLVKISYEDKQPVIFSIKEAIEAESYLGNPQVVSRGDTKAGFQESDDIIEGELHIPGQKHMYLETINSLVTPKERGEIEVLCGTQMPSDLQSFLAEVLGLAAHKISVRVKRLGGSFGGKDSRAFVSTFPTAVAAVKFNCPVRNVLSRPDDTTVVGGRHPVLLKYKVGYKSTGKIVCLEFKIFANAGHTIDITDFLLSYLLLNGHTAYNIPSFHAQGRICRTNLSSYGAMRGFSRPQNYWFMENIVNAIATKLNSCPEKIRELNMYHEGDTTLGGVLLKPCFLRTCWKECQKMSQFEERLKEIDQFNRVNTLKKRGISLLPTMFAIGIYAKCMNQAGSLVNVYTDGSVLVTHGGCEMGQGLHTKIKQIASDTLGVDYNKILVSETTTNVIPNATVTAASISTDICGGAVHAACLAILERLQPFREADPSAGWDEWVKAAYFNRVSLSATGFYKMGDFGYDFEKGTGPDCFYYTYSTGCSEVELDCLTGEHKLLRTDIVMELGRSLNPAIDIGQIEGAFVQGYGMYMLEDVVHTDEGRLITASPLTYKVPLCSDIPAQFNVAILKNSTNDKAIYSSKGIGEPAFILSLSAYLALREAVKSAREDKGLEKMFLLETPAIPANVLKCLK